METKLTKITRWQNIISQVSDLDKLCNLICEFKITDEFCKGDCGDENCLYEQDCIRRWLLQEVLVEVKDKSKKLTAIGEMRKCISVGNPVGINEAREQYEYALTCELFNAINPVDDITIDYVIAQLEAYSKDLRGLHLPIDEDFIGSLKKSYFMEGKIKCLNQTLSHQD